MRSPILKHCAGRGYNSPLSQLNANTKLKDVPNELGNTAMNVVRSGMNAIGNVTLGDAGKFAADAIYPGASAIVKAVVKDEGNGMVKRNNPFNVDPGRQSNAFTTPTRPSSNGQLDQGKRKIKQKPKPIATKPNNSSTVSKPNDSSAASKARRGAEEIFDEVAAKGY